MTEPSRNPSVTPFRVQRRFHVPYADIDMLQHLNHAAYFRYMETLRCDYYVPFISSSNNPAELDIIIAEATCRYLAPVQFNSVLIGEVAPARPLGRSSFQLLYRFRRETDGVVTARGRTVVVCYDYAKASKKEIPPERRRLMELDSADPSEEGW
ncbi:MAG: acyl-CoA thioesterase [Thermoplasmata archaeon]